jgi:hypothetical protein
MYQVMNIQVGHILFQSKYYPDSVHMCAQWQNQLPSYAHLIKVIDETTGEIVYE